MDGVDASTTRRAIVPVLVIRALISAKKGPLIRDTCRLCDQPLLLLVQANRKGKRQQDVSGAWREFHEGI
jgi:hypothetical protein